MHRQDVYGHRLSTTSDQAASHYCAGISAFLRMGMGADVELQAAVDTDPDFAVAQALLSFVLSLRGQADRAQVAAVEARRAAESGTERERRHVEVVTAWTDEDARAAAGMADDHLEDFPDDGIVLFVSGLLEVNAGRPDRQHRRYHQLKRLAAVYGEDSFFLGVAGFAAQEVGEHQEARDLAERSLSADPRSGFGTHVMTHVLYETAQHSEGVAFLDGWLPDFDRRHPYHAHFSWHAALHELALGDLEAMWSRYDRDIKPVEPTMAIRLSDSSSLLFRLHLYGVAEDPLPWTEVVELARTIAATGGPPLAIAHAAFVLGLHGEQGELNELRNAIGRAGIGRLPATPELIGLCDAFETWRSGDLSSAAAQLEQLSPTLVRIGGSNAQREVFEDALIHSWMETGEVAKAAATLEARLARRSSERDEAVLEVARVALRGSALSHGS